MTDYATALTPALPHPRGLARCCLGNINAQMKNEGKNGTKHRKANRRDLKRAKQRSPSRGSIHQLVAVCQKATGLGGGRDQVQGPPQPGIRADPASKQNCPSCYSWTFEKDLFDCG